jgi:protein TonB
MNAAVQKPDPAYPPLARQLKLEGSVQLEALILENGAVDNVNIVSGNPVLTRAGVDALKHWKFTPFQSGGKPVKALAPITFDFKL